VLDRPLSPSSSSRRTTAIEKENDGARQIIDDECMQRGKESERERASEREKGIERESLAIEYESEHTRVRI
jgi:hypothetical protein